MTLHDFENFFDKKILERGLEYFKSGNVVSLEYDGDEWVAEVEGSEDYTVIVKLSDSGEIADTSCDCPYDMGKYCKHQSAVFFALRRAQPGKPSPKTTKKESLDALLERLDKRELQSIIMELANKNRSIKEALLLRYANGKDIFKHARNVIKSAISAVKRGGYVEYGDVSRAVSGADTVLIMADEKIDSGDILSAVSLCFIVIEEMMSLFDCCDDSNAYVGGTIENSIEKIGEAVKAMPPGREDEIFMLIFGHASDSIYDGWTQWRLELLSAAVPLCVTHGNREKMEYYLSGEYNKTKQEDGRYNYKFQRLQKFHSDIIRRFDGEEAAAAFMEKHIGNSDFRLALIKTAIENKEYEKALNMCLDGEWEDEVNANAWKCLRYSIYEKTGDTSGQKKTGQELLVEGNFDYYEKLKKLYPSNEWTPIVKNILERLKIQDRKGIYVKILVQEKLKPQLFEYCKQHPYKIISLYEHLLPEYSEEVGKIILKLIQDNASRANSRKDYSDICGLILHYKKVCGKDRAAAVRDGFKLEFAKRPAFLDELSKI